MMGHIYILISVGSLGVKIIFKNNEHIDAMIVQDIQKLLQRFAVIWPLKKIA